MRNEETRMKPLYSSCLGRLDFGACNPETLGPLSYLTKPPPPHTLLEQIIFQGALLTSSMYTTSRQELTAHPALDKQIVSALGHDPRVDLDGLPKGLLMCIKQSDFPLDLSLFGANIHRVIEQHANQKGFSG